MLFKNKISKNALKHKIVFDSAGLCQLFPVPYSDWQNEMQENLAMFSVLFGKGNLFQKVRNFSRCFDEFWSDYFSRAKINWLEKMSLVENWCGISVFRSTTALHLFFCIIYALLHDMSHPIFKFSLFSKKMKNISKCVFLCCIERLFLEFSVADLQMSFGGKNCNSKKTQ